MPHTNPDVALLVFAKAPRPGAVKTRLVPLLGAEGAAALHRRLTVRTLAAARDSALGEIELHAAPDCDDPFLTACAHEYGARLVPQVAGDLGTRMAAALEAALSRSARAILVGTDCPVLTPHHLHQANSALRDADAVLVPTEDGGYALVGLARHDARLFSGIHWGTERVMDETRTRLTELGWRWRELETLWDVDRPADYQRLQALAINAGPLSDSPAETGS